MKTQVLVVDDSEVYRLFLRQSLANEPDIEVVSVASNGRLALPRVNHYKPEVVLLDDDMPDLDGLSAIPEIKRLSPQTRIIMFSSHTTKGARLTLRALDLGADDFITKPASALGGNVADELRVLILERIRAFTVRPEPVVARPVAPGPPVSPCRTTGKKKFRYCLIGISTGGPPALRRLLRLIPPDIQGSILIVQHMPPLFTAQLAESLNEESRLKVVEARDNSAAEPGTVYIAPGGKQMKLLPHGTGAVIRVEESDPAELCKPSVNILFNSAAEFCPEETLAVIMTGMGEDGYLGMKNLAARGAYLMAQEAGDCVIFGMPAKPVRDGIIHESHNVEGLAAKITEYLR